jgi:ABC-2 type transport system permease protein
MTEGSLEMMFASPVRPTWVLALPCLWTFLFEGLRGALLVGFGVLVCGAEMPNANTGTALLVGVASLTACSVFGLVAAAIIIVVKRGDPINWIFASTSSLLGGALFPVEMLPPWLGAISAALPTTYAYHGMRMAMLRGATPIEVGGDLAVLVAFSVLGLPVAFILCEAAVSRAKRDGSLGSF